MAFFCGSQAQNVQFHYDLGHNLSKDLSNRPAVTTTVEMFKPDKWGSTFLFTDNLNSAALFLVRYFYILK